MRGLLLYFLQVILASGLLYGYYHLFLRNNKFHQYNRFYLLAATVLSLIIPLLHIDFYFASPQDIPAIYQMMDEVRAGKAVTVRSGELSFLNWQTIVQFIFFLVCFILLLRLIISVRYIMRIRKKHSAHKLENISFIVTREPGTPFSFFRWLFWHKDIPVESRQGQKIFRHELFHIQQKHSWDIIYLELITVFCWINPFFHLIKNETKAIHEFLADQFAADHDDKWEYAELLVMQTLQTRRRFVNPFFHNQIKRRIAMITHSTRPSFKYMRKLMALPLTFFIVTILAVNCTSKDAKKNLQDTKNTEQKEQPVFKTVILDSARMAEQTKRDLQSAETGPQPGFPGGKSAWALFLKKHLNSNVPVDNGAAEGQYKVVVLFLVDKNGRVSNLNTVTHWGYGMEEEVLRVMKLCPVWKPAIKDGKAVEAYKAQPITFQITSE